MKELTRLKTEAAACTSQVEVYESLAVGGKSQAGEYKSPGVV